MDTKGGGGSVTTVADRWSADDLEALRQLYEPLRRFAAVIGGWDVEPDDLVQDAFAKVLRREPGEIRDLGPYLRRAVANLATDARRRSRRAASYAPRLASEPAAADSYPSDLADLLALPPRVRALLYLVEVEGEQIAPAAACVGMTSSTARVALLRARRKLRAELSEELSSE